MKKRSLIAILIIALMLSVVIVACKDNTVPTLGEESGIYYFDADSKNEYTITLSSGNKFLFIVKGENKSGTYERVDKTITLTFDSVKVGDDIKTKEPIDITYNHANRTLSYDGMTFLERVIYKVSFDSKGGSDVDDQYIVNGRYADTPNAPTNGKQIFAGWYTQDDKLFNFDSDAITNDTSLVAIWRKNDNAPSYKIDFDLNYQNAPKQQSLQTVGGKLFSENVLIPSLPGHTFKGWWISVTDNKDELSYMWTESYVFEESTTLFGLWQDNSTPIKPVVYIEENLIRWDSTGAGSYRLEIDGPVGFSFTTKTTGLTQEEVRMNVVGEYTIRLTANNQTTTRKYIHRGLSKVSLFEVIDSNILLFNQVKNATSYDITITCGNLSHNHKNHKNGNSTYYNFSNCTMPKEGISFVVVASANGFVSSQSKEFVYYRKLDKIEHDDFTYDKDNQIVSWKKIDNATEYFVNGKNIGNNQSYSIKEYPKGEATIKVMPFSQGYNSEESELKIDKTTIATPKNIRVAGNKVLWDGVGSSYDIRVDGRNNPINTASYTLDRVDGSVEISVRERGNSSETDSLYSDPIIITEKMSDITYRQGTVYWNYVFGAEKYEIKLNNGSTIVTDLGVNNHKIELNQADNNTIAVRPFGQEDDWSRLTVFAYEISFDSRQGSAVESQFRAMGDVAQIGQEQEPAREDFVFMGWYNSVFGPLNNSKIYESDFIVSSSLTLYAYWTQPVNVIFNYGDEDSNDFETIEFGTEFNLGNPQLDGKKPSAIEESKSFIGWYTKPGGAQTDGNRRLTDENGKGYGEWDLTGAVVVYAYWDEVIRFELESDGTYGITKGSYIFMVSTLDVPSQYKGKNITIIKGNAFKDCSSLKSITLPGTIRVVNTGAFENCTILEEITVKNQTDASIYVSEEGVLYKRNVDAQDDEWDFVLFPKRKSGAFTLPKQVKFIPEATFQGLTGLISVTLHDDVTSIGAKAFKDSSITSIKLSSKLGFIGNQAFENTKIKTIDMPNTLTDLGSHAFNNCNQLESVTISNAITIISDYTFNNCTNLTEIRMVVDDQTLINVLPQSLISVGTRAFNNCGITSITLPGTLDNNIVGTDDTSRMLGISPYAFAGSKIQSLTFAECTMSSRSYENPLIVGEYAFSNCTSLKEITFENGWYIETLINAFENCGFENLVITENFVGLGDKAFLNNSKLQTVVLESRAKAMLPSADAIAEWISNSTGRPRYTNSVMSAAFGGCSKLVSISFEDGFATANNSSYYDIGTGFATDCSSLQYIINLPDGRYSQSAFSSTVKDISFNSNYSREELPSFLKNISSLEQVTVPSTLTKISGQAFYQNGERIKQVIVEHKEGSQAKISSTSSGIVLSADKTTIMYYPGGKDAEEYQVPATISMIAENAFSGISKLKAVLFLNESTTISANAFKDAISLQSIKLPSQLTVIPDSVFEGCINLSTIDIGQAQITSIGKSAFASNKSLTAIDFLPASIESISSSAFMDCSGLTKVSLPASITVVPSSAFKGASKLSNITLLGQVTTIKDSAFEDCTQLASLSFIPNSIISIGESAFKGCIGLENITVPAIDKIEKSTFENCVNLTDVIISNDTTIINDFAFRGCVKLEDVTLSNTINTIGEYAFADCTNLTTLFIPSTIENLSGTAFNNSGITSLNFESGGTYSSDADGGVFKNGQLIAYLGDGDYRISSGTTIPSGVFSNNDGLVSITIANNIASIAVGAFENCTSLTKVVIESGSPITSIPKNAFKGCESLQEVEIQGTSSLLRTIDESAFEGCIELETIDTSMITAIRNNAFYNCIKLTSVNILSVTTIGECAFYNCGKLQTLKFASGLREISNSAFQNCVGLTSITFPQFMSKIGDSAFQNCKELESVAMPYELKELNKNIFKDCVSLQSITLRSDLTTIGESAFENCIKLQSITLPSKVKGSGGEGQTGIRAAAFKGCIALESINLENITKINNDVFNGCKSLESVTVAQDAEIGKNAFKDCVKLEDVVLNGNHKIGESAFAGSGIKEIDLTKVAALSIYAFQNATKLESVTIPARLLSLPNYTFSGCSSLKDVTFVETDNFANKTLGTMAIFQNCESLERIIIPDGITGLGSNSFQGCTSLEYIRLPEKTLTSIQASVFDGCINLKGTMNMDGVVDTLDNTDTPSFNIPSNGLIMNIGGSAFKNCESIKAINIPSSVVDRFSGAIPGLGNAAFLNCSGLEVLVFEEEGEIEGASLTLQNAFKNCKNLKEVRLPARVTDLGSGSDFAFDGCDSLESFVISENNANYSSQNGFILSKDRKTLEICPIAKSGEITISDGVTSVASNAFKGCGDITAITFPVSFESFVASNYSDCTKLFRIVVNTGNANYSSVDGVLFDSSKETLIHYPVAKDNTSYAVPDKTKKIEVGAFNGNKKIESLTLPSSVVEIGNYAFAGCTNIAVLEIRSDKIESINKNAFDDWTSIQEIHLLSLSQKPNGWDDDWHGNATTIWLG